MSGNKRGDKWAVSCNRKEQASACRCEFMSQKRPYFAANTLMLCRFATLPLFTLPL
jgi:hypothetical protein